MSEPLETNTDMLWTTRMGTVIVWCSCELVIHVFTPTTSTHTRYDGEEWEPWSLDSLNEFAEAWMIGKLQDQEIDREYTEE